MVTPEGAALGVIDAGIWARGPKDEAPVKESTRWVEGYEIVADLASQVPDTRLVYGADREGDLRALRDAAARRGTPADWLVRATHNRHTTAGEKVWDRLAWTEPLGAVEFRLPAAPGRPARMVRQTLYREPVTLPARNGTPALPVTAILAREEHPPAGEKAIEWRLLTNRVAETLEAVVELINWYRRRWRIEIYQPYNLRKTLLMINGWWRAIARYGWRLALLVAFPTQPHRLGSATADAPAG